MRLSSLALISGRATLSALEVLNMVIPGGRSCLQMG